MLSKDESDFIISKTTQAASSDDLFLIDVYSPFNKHLMTVQKLNADEERVSTITKLSIYKNNAEKYEYLVKNNPQDKWIEEFKQTKEYELLYE